MVTAEIFLNNGETYKGHIENKKNRDKLDIFEILNDV